MMSIEVKNFIALDEAMKRLCEFLADCSVSEERVFDSKLVVSELVGNVLRHSDGIASVEWKIDGAFIELVIRSTVRYIPPEVSRLADVYAENGRGLFLVDAVCEERRTIEDGGIKVKIRIK